MRSYLSTDEYVIEEAVHGRDALSVLAEMPIDLIISDFEMPTMDGLALLQKVRDTRICKFILVSEFSSALQARQAYQLGADEFLNKPFGRDDLMKAIQSAYAEKEEVEDKYHDLEYIQVPLEEFITGTVLKVDLYVRISLSKYIKIGSKNARMDQERVESYMKKGLKWLYMRREDFAVYVGMNITLAQKAHTETKIECARKIRLTMHVTETLIAQLREIGVDRTRLEETSNVVMNAVELILSSYDTMKLLESIEENGTLPEHSIAVGIWSCLIAKQLGWKGHSTFFRLAICALFHDIGNKELDEKLVQKQRFELSRQEAKLFETHTTRGRDILQSVPGMLEEAATVAHQHHELFRGGGYPNGFRMQQIHPLALLVGLADRLCELLKYGGKDIGLMAAFDKLAVNDKDFEPSHFKALKTILDQVRAKQKSAA